jgi:hypothetical protein
MKILINNEEVLCDKNIVIEEEMLNTSSVILNNVFPKSWDTDKDYVSSFYYPPDYSNCLIYDDNNNLIFCGIVRNTGEISLDPRQPHYCNLQVLDYKDFLSQGETLDFVLTNVTITEAINQIVNTISEYGFEVGNIDILNDDEIIGSYSTKDMTAYDVFNYIADITQSRWTTRMISPGVVAIDFYDPTLLPEGLEIDYTKEFFEQYDILNLSYSYATNDYRNKQVMTSDQVYGNLEQTQTIYTDGYSTQFMTELMIGEINVITLNGVEMTFTTKDQKDAGVVADFYYTVASNILETDNILSAGQEIDISYIPIVEGRQVIINSNEVDRIANATGVKGVIARYENRNDATTSNELQQIGQSYITYKGVPEISLNVSTLQNLWNVGDRVQFNAPLEELDTEYMVKKKTIKYIASIDKIFYEYEMTSSFNSENAINYFDNQRMKAKGNIAEGEFISRNIDINNTANVIFFDSEIEEVQIDGDNVLNSILNSPFVQ